MDDRTAQALVALNRRFYDESGDAFGATRRRGWRGWQRVLAALPARRPLRVLDLGCGNARLLGFLREAGIEVDYLGLDASDAMLSQARAAHTRSGVRFEHAALHEVGREAGTQALPDERFDFVAIFGLMHHLPARRRRATFLAHACSRAAAGGVVAVSWWRFQRDARFARRRIGWDEATALRDPAVATIDQAQLEGGDALLRFGEGEAPPRYCHFADDAEIDWLLGETAARGASLVERFQDDGRDRDLNDYALLRVAGNTQ